MEMYRMRFTILLVQSCFVASMAATAADDTWTQWRGHDAAGRISTLPDGVPSFKRLWKQPVAGECYAGTVIKGSRVILTDHGKGFDRVSALSLDDGSVLWSNTYTNTAEISFGSGPRTTPLILDNKVFVMNALGVTRCLDIASGKQHWRTPTDTNMPTWGFCGSPLAANGNLLLCGGAQDGPVAAYRPDDGKRLWAAQDSSMVNYATFLPGTFGGVRQIIGYDDASLGGWSLDNGQRLWKHKVDTREGYICPMPCAVGEGLLITTPSEGARLYGFASDGTLNDAIISSSDAIFPEMTAPTVVGNLVFGSGELLTCLDAANGLATLWTLEHDDLYGEISVIAGPRRLFAFCDGYAAIIDYDRQSASTVAGQKLCEETYSHPAIAQSRVIVRDSAFIYCYDLRPAPVKTTPKP
jgi:outer membrane protein assembly factor BamB